MAIKTPQAKMIVALYGGQAGLAATLPNMTKVKTRFKIKPRHFIKEWRKFRHLSQEALAERMGLTHGAVGQVERGDVKYSQDFLEAAAEQLECSPADLLMRNPLDAEAPWSIWSALKPEQKKQAIRLLEALKDEAA